MTVLIVGAGAISQEYVEVCLDQGETPLVVTRGEPRAEELRSEFTSVDVISGGLAAYLDGASPPRRAILATPVDTLDNLCRQLISAGVDRILSEKPLTLSTADAADLYDFARQNGAEVRIAYNRRHYRSVAKAREIIEADGGATSFYMDFTEALFRIAPDAYADEVLHRWGIANSSHVIDTAFHLCGRPEVLEAHQAGSGISWHSNGSLFYGNGVTTQNVHFAYHANWAAPGRWRIEINTSDRKLLFSPMERLKIQPADTFAVEEVDIDYSLDEAYKPGFYQQTQAFLTNSDDHLLPLAELETELGHLEEIFGY